MTKFQVRAYLALAGLAAIMLGMAASTGVLFVLGFSFNMMHGGMMFLLLGEFLFEGNSLENIY